VIAGLETKGFPHSDGGNQEQVKNQVVQATAAVLGAVSAPPVVSGAVAAALAIAVLPIASPSNVAPVVPVVPQATSPSSAAPVVPPGADALNPFPELMIQNQAVTLVDSDRIVVSGGAFSRSQLPSPFQVLNSAVTFAGAGIDSLLQI